MTLKLVDMGLEAWLLVMTPAVVPQVSYRIVELECGSDFEIILLNFLNLCKEIEATIFLLKATQQDGSSMRSILLPLLNERGP